MNLLERRLFRLSVFYALILALFFAASTKAVLVQRSGDASEHLLSRSREKLKAILGGGEQRSDDGRTEPRKPKLSKDDALKAYKEKRLAARAERKALVALEPKIIRVPSAAFLANRRKTEERQVQLNEERRFQDLERSIANEVRQRDRVIQSFERRTKGRRLAQEGRLRDQVVRHLKQKNVIPSIDALDVVISVVKPKLISQLKQKEQDEDEWSHEQMSEAVGKDDAFDIDFSSLDIDVAQEVISHHKMVAEEEERKRLEGIRKTREELIEREVKRLAERRRGERESTERLTWELAATHRPEALRKQIRLQLSQYLDRHHLAPKERIVDGIMEVLGYRLTERLNNDDDEWKILKAAGLGESGEADAGGTALLDALDLNVVSIVNALQGDYSKRDVIAAVRNGGVGLPLAGWKTNTNGVTYDASHVDVESRRSLDSNEDPKEQEYPDYLDYDMRDGNFMTRFGCRGTAGGEFVKTKVSLPAFPPRAFQHKFMFIGGLDDEATDTPHEWIRAARSVNDVSTLPGDGSSLQDVFHEWTHLGINFEARDKNAPTYRANADGMLIGSGPWKAFDETSPWVNPCDRMLLFRQWATKFDLNKSILVEKSPPNIIRTRFLSAMLPRKHVFHVEVIRHPIAPTKGRCEEGMCIPVIEAWLKTNDRLLEDMRHLSTADRVRVVRFETLSTVPNRIMCGLSDWVNGADSDGVRCFGVRPHLKGDLFPIPRDSFHALADDLEAIQHEEHMGQFDHVFGDTTHQRVAVRPTPMVKPFYSIDELEQGERTGSRFTTT
eukprot:TRINITY_DN8582_c0_g1_i1.p1 TRINITY_DN8582_c0_g1~~TRINITY_DN8582_c0_g1_i1.p1  ORF type:complete len:783 (-),score=129.01 TRINITY_DN8582_c0_g1_i1:522-2870(-)